MAAADTFAIPSSEYEPLTSRDPTYDNPRALLGLAAALGIEGAVFVAGWSVWMLLK